MLPTACTRWSSRAECSAGRAYSRSIAPPRMQLARTARHPSGCHLLRCAASADGDAPESSANDEEAGELEDVVEDELEDDFLNKKLRRILKVAADEASTLHANYGREFFDEAGQRLHHDSTQAEVHYVPLLEEGEEPGALPEPANMTVADLEARLTILPGVQRVLARKDLAGLDSAQSLIEHWDHSVEPDHALPPENRGDGLREYLYPAEKPEDITQWDLRARMDWFARMRKGAAVWDESREQVRLKKSVGADWRTDLRIKTTSNPLDPVYREWNHREIWDLITLDGNGADPRDVPFKIEWHNSPADYQIEDAKYQPEHIDWLESMGMVIPEEDEALIVDRDSEVALLASEFSDFDDDYTAPESPEYNDEVGFDETEGASSEF